MLGSLGDMIDLGELVRRAVKYLVEGLVVGFAAFALPKPLLALGFATLGFLPLNVAGSSG